MVFYVNYKEVSYSSVIRNPKASCDRPPVPGQCTVDVAIAVNSKGHILQLILSAQLEDPSSLVSFTPVKEELGVHFVFITKGGIPCLFDHCFHQSGGRKGVEI